MKQFTSLAIRSLVTLLIGSAILAANLQAQTYAVKVRVPFPFTVGTQSIAPGTYQFSLATSAVGSNQFLLSVLDVKTGDTEMFAVRPERQRTFEPHGHLLFRNIAGRSALAEVHFPRTHTFSELIQPRPGAAIETAWSQTSKPTCVARR